MAGPLGGLKVVQLASLAPAPFGCMVLADLGAEVIRVERAGGGDALSVPSGYFDRGQRSIAVDLRSPEGVQVVLDLIRDADVLVEGFRPGVTERLGIGPEDCWKVNRGLVYGRLTGFGQDGPLASAAGHDINYIAVSGALEPIGRAGERPYAPLNIVADFAGGGFLLAIGVLAALRERDVSGEGQVVDAAMVDGSALLTTFFHGMASAGLWTDQRGTNFFDGGAAFYDTYECSDGGFMAVGAVEPQFYALLLDKLGLTGAALPHPFDTDRADELRAVFADVFRTRTRAEWTEVFDGVDACVTPVLSPWEAHEHPHNAARGTFVDVAGKRQPAPAPRFSRTPAPTPGAAPRPGADTDTLLAGLGYDAAAVADLRDRDVIG
ncbi:MAG: CoA transferase [Nocardioidaceae bacterium]|nr:CoA transferase [Nocardioidaceae bacterium]MCL2612190.1 CoA transferase [Nocardioidaceae bacterium]